MTSPNNYVAGPNNHMAGPNNYVASPDNHMAGLRILHRLTIYGLGIFSNTLIIL
jgi:hypothetical protein